MHFLIHSPADPSHRFAYPWFKDEKAKLHWGLLLRLFFVYNPSFVSHPYYVLWFKLCVSPHPTNLHIEVLTPSTSECDCIWRRGLLLFKIFIYLFGCVRSLLCCPDLSLVVAPRPWSVGARLPQIIWDLSSPTRDWLNPHPLHWTMGS